LCRRLRQRRTKRPLARPVRRCRRYTTVTSQTGCRGPVRATLPSYPWRHRLRWWGAGVVGRRRRGRRLAFRRRNGRGWVRGKGVAGPLGANAGHVGNLAPRPVDPDVIPPLASTTSGSPCAGPILPTLPATPPLPRRTSPSRYGAKTRTDALGASRQPRPSPGRGELPARETRDIGSKLVPGARPASGGPPPAEPAGHPAPPPYKPRPLRRQDASRRPRRLPTAPPERRRRAAESSPGTWCRSSAPPSSVKTMAAQAAWSWATSSLISLSV
jgi:hypothetical protein